MRTAYSLGAAVPYAAEKVSDQTPSLHNPTYFIELSKLLIKLLSYV